ncbi:MAG: hypothetical protein IPP17_00985 [Bacteroidetes bacterium]|nr:hypothetical protein [Bacteroidota bacterium]
MTHKNRKKRPGFRNWPEPLPRCTYWRKPNWRRPKTTNERRAATERNEEGYHENGCRAKRNAQHLWFAWDDKMRSNLRCRNWKRHRLTQWKE